MPALIMLIMLVALWFLTTQTSSGWRLYSVGEQPQVARLLGVSPDRYKSYGLLISSLMAALAGILYAARTGTAEPFGKFAYTLDSFVAVTIGQTLLLRGKPNILGTLVGVFILGVLSNGVVLVGAPFFLQEIVKGVLILIGVVIIARLQWG
jgi:ribose transport system permease protein